MKKNVIFRIAAIVLMCTLVTACFASSTFAKYTSQAKATDSAVVAKWDIEYDGTKLDVVGSPKNITVDIFNDSAIAGHNANDINKQKIAPGTNGSFTIAQITNESDVVADIAVTAIVTNTNNIPIKWSTDGSTWSDEFPSLATLSNTVNPGGTLGPVEGTTIYWQWAYYESAAQDNDDTTLGLAATAQVTVDLTITATQVD